MPFEGALISTEDFCRFILIAARKRVLVVFLPFFEQIIRRLVDHSELRIESLDQIAPPAKKKAAPEPAEKEPSAEAAPEIPAPAQPEAAEETPTEQAAGADDGESPAEAAPEAAAAAPEAALKAHPNPLKTLKSVRLQKKTKAPKQKKVTLGIEEELKAIAAQGADIPRVFERPEAAAAPEMPAPSSPRYFGYVSRNGGDFYNYYAVLEWANGRFDPIPDTPLQMRFPQWGGVNLKLGRRRPPREGAFYVVDFDKLDLDLNYDPNHNVRTDYKFALDYETLLVDQRFQRASDFNIFIVVKPAEADAKVDLSSSSISVTAAGRAAEDTRVNLANERVLFEHDGLYYGPVTLRQNASRQYYVNLSSIAENGIVPAWRRTNQLALTSFSVFAPEADASNLYVPVRCAFTNLMTRVDVDILSDEALLKDCLAKARGASADDLLASIRDNGLSAQAPADVLRARLARTELALMRESAFASVRDELVDAVAREVLPRDQALTQALVERAAEDPKLREAFTSNDRIGLSLRKATDALNQLAEDRREAEAKTAAAKAELGSCERRTQDVKDQLAGYEKRLAFLSEHEQGLSRLEELNTAIDRLKGEEAAVRNLREAVLKEVNDAVARAAELGPDILPERLVEAAGQWNEIAEAERLANQADRLGARCAARRPMLDRAEVASILVKRLQSVRNYDENMILNMYISIVQNFLTVFAGEPGAGKTSICRLIAGSLGLTRECMPAEFGSRFVEVPVEYGWTTKRDLIGYWNPLSNKFESSDPERWQFVRMLDAEARSRAGSCYPALMLLDEANLSPMEYYWSDWMRLCDEQGASGEPAPISLWDKSKTLIPNTLRFLATINNDNTTEPLSPRLIDRAAVITLPQIDVLDAVPEKRLDAEGDALLAWSDLQAAFGARRIDRNADQVHDLLKVVDQHANELGIRLSSRSRRQVEGYGL